MPADMTDPAGAGDPVEELLHRVNNLLGTIAAQSMVVEAKGDLETCREAIRMIRESAERTGAEVAAFRRRRGATDASHSTG